MNLIRLCILLGTLLFSQVVNASVNSTFSDLNSRSKILPVTVTSYCLKSKMSNGQKTHHGCIALSRDLIKSLNVKFGDIVEVQGLGTFVYKDWMPHKWKRRVDIWLPSYKHCSSFGVKKSQIKVVKRSNNSR